MPQHVAERREGLRWQTEFHGQAGIQGPAIDSVALCMIRNEQDIIEPFLRHTAARVDLVVVLDNCSTDGSRAIITKLAQELGNIVVTDLPDRGYHQSQTMTRVLAHVQSAVFADFVFFLDADEFLAGDSKQAVLEGLRGLAPMSVGLMPWVTYVPDATLSEDGVPDPLDRLTLRRTHEAPQYYKAVLRMAGGFDPALQVLHGNHHIKGGNGRKLRAQVLDAMPLAHMPLRSTAQMKAKGVIGWAANSQRKDAQHSKDAYQWKHLSELATSGTRLTTPLLMSQALAYAQDDRSGPPEDHLEAAAHGIDTTRQYSDGSFGDPDQLIADAQSGVMGDTQAFALPAPPAGSEQETEVSNAFMGNWHWDYLFLDEAPIRFAIERFAPASALDLGCGNGLYPALYRHLGVADVLGVDGLLPEATVLDAQSYVQADLQEPFDAGRKFDLVVCLEVVEHINPAATDVLFDSIADQSKGHILFRWRSTDSLETGT